jgi:rhamnose transport system substrate-binding protein
MTAGFRDASKTLGFEFVTVAPAKADATSQIPFIKDQIQRHVDIIAISANSPNALNTVLDEATKAGILVVTVDSDLTGNESHRAVGVMPTDTTKTGDSLLEVLGSQINYAGDFAILSATSDAPNQNAWIEGMKKALVANPKFAKMKLVDVVYGDDDEQKSETEASALLTKHPGLRGIIAPTTAGLPATAHAIELAGAFPGGPHAVGGGVMVTGLALPNGMRHYVEAGIVKGFQLWSPHDAGVLTANIAIQIKTGKLKVAEGAEFDVPNMGKHKFEKNNVVIAGPMLTFDKANIAQYKF